MGTLVGTNAITLADWAARMDDDGKIAMIINLLSQQNEMLKDMLVVEANQATSHKTTVRTGLPTATWRLLNYGVAQGKSTTAQVVDTCGNLETYSTIDKDIADLNGNTPEFRLSEDLGFVEGMNQQVAGTAVYGNTGLTPERFMGFAPRYNSVVAATAATAVNVIDALGSGSDNTSMWVIVWGPNTNCGFFPKGKISGLQQEDLGRWTVYDGANNPYEAYRTHFKWELGLSVRDWRYNVRIANIDVSDLIAGTGVNLINAMIRAVHRLPTAPIGASSEQESDAPGAMSAGSTVIYCNRTVRTYLDIQATNKTNVLLRMEQWAGEVVTTFRGIPVRTVDQIVNNETRVV